MSALFVHVKLTLIFTRTNKSFQSPELQVKKKPSTSKFESAVFPAEFSSSDMEQPDPEEKDIWAESITKLSYSPDNLIALGESPPDLYSTEETGKFLYTKNEQRTVSSGYPPLVSPPKSKRRPLSFQLAASNTQDTDNLKSEAPFSARRNTMYSQPRYASRPPLPHQAQAHYFGAPDASLMLSSSKSGLIPGESGYYCGFDVLVKENVVVAGYNGGIKIYAISKRGLNKISGIDGLRGGVHNAKILPWTVGESDSGLFPLIALVINGPCRETEKAPDEMVNSEESSPSCSSNSRENTYDADFYQTTVELYSLSGAKQHISTLLSLPKTHLKIPLRNTLPKVPNPVGALNIRADSGNLIITSGTTGETWIFRQAGCDESSKQQLKCIGKIWTTVQQSVSAESISPKLFDEPRETESQLSRNQCNVSILSLNGRWLAYCPSAPSSQTSLRATVPGLQSTVKVPGLNTYSPPQVPGINCGVETPGGESVMKQIVQMGTQKVIKAGNYLAQQGMQAWTNYRNKPATNPQLINGGLMFQTPETMAPNFPPTHGPPTPASFGTKDPGLISILDLNTLSEHVSSTGSSSIYPISTFRVPHGCSFLSFSPDGLFLFTASSKGDLQFVWDLMRIKYTKTSFMSSEPMAEDSPGPHVRQVAQFFRMTVARIVDVVWTSPYGERVAMVTEPGTIHILDIPASAFTGTPYRRRPPLRKSADTASGSSASTITATGVATSAVSSLWTAARPLVSRPRRSSACLSAKAVTTQAGNGTQAIAAGISRSVGAATGKMNEIRKLGGNKLHLPHNATVPERSCVLLLNKKRHDLVIALAGRLIRLYAIKSRRADRLVDKKKTSVKMLVEYQIPMIPDRKFASDISLDLSSDELTTREVKETSRKTMPQKLSKGPSIYYTESSIPQAEIEPNAPYQPFYTGRGIGLYVYGHPNEPVASTSSPNLQSLNVTETGDGPNITSEDAWVFGGPITCDKLDVGSYYNPEDELEDLIESHTLPSSKIESVMRISDNSEESEQIIITTRRRKAPLRPDTDDAIDEFGFFEDGCEVLDIASQKR
ncbi:hypothetical protein K3495_g7639 [Podosphaera aphanis]|nr:hypothetical protein K3495_g7639 [Podosphaera aphanis]